MLPGLGFSEVLVLGVIALLVVGPKDLPLMLRKLGRQMARLRGLAAEFRTGFDELARQAELDELKKEVEALRRGQIFSDAEMEQMRVLEPLPAPA
ncbi:MAG: twin-arginine translocase subunit TatB, partial [Hyphomonadaceae bacterium]|nr:twin-arginine translocase subunit TatB [Hyphomonadaceae bacterium]